MNTIRQKWLEVFRGSSDKQSAPRESKDSLLSERRIDDELIELERAILDRSRPGCTNASDRLTTLFELDAASFEKDNKTTARLRWRLRSLKNVLQYILVAHQRLDEATQGGSCVSDLVPRMLGVIEKYFLSIAPVLGDERPLLSKVTDNESLADWLEGLPDLDLLADAAAITVKLFKLNKTSESSVGMAGSSELNTWLTSPGKEEILLISFVTSPQIVTSANDPLFSEVCRVHAMLDDIISRDTGPIRDFPRLHSISPNTTGTFVTLVAQSGAKIADIIAYSDI
ncbi:hypothetical protein [Palleronia caenipelagi]|uniref:Uncharacterized protein n=1 Tax=Palleronia caenipelagi TaxID=2489174 RepID=A0A547PLC6_9RHOB|nr:hypothetical protein [Palleronia caenipelagi]TRD14947.1 hypothetical protein FEV53_18020 [Palleronia caenipelagi]